MNNDKELKKIEERVNDYIVERKLYQTFAYDNLPFFYIISMRIIKSLEKYFDGEIYLLPYQDIPRASIDEKIGLIKSFYRDMNIDLDIDRLIADGTIGFKYYGLNSKYYPSSYGESYYHSKKLINSCNNGLVTDAIVLVHELSHFRDQPEDGMRKYINDLYTEALAFTEEFIFADYLQQKGYDIYVPYMRNVTSMLFSNVQRMASVFRMFLTYENLGDLSQESYSILFDKDNYQEDFQEFKSFLNNKYGEELDSNCNYVFATFLAPYLYMKYQDDYSFIEAIKRLHTLTITGDYYQILKEIGLRDYDINALDEIEKSLISMKDLFIKKSKVKSKTLRD